ncbi:putative polyprenyl diphosphate synthase [Actinacidiphila reveromycinica]|uniref:Putative polyprenyl diphosphate synthase n=1 Tax=Actinacidiphila reveromycinica TaxID=659352 RepID=A0A7U3UZX6_9ACTN|nr:polyprenyl synthetase family protein [Streptomyces sp. SN-593]BBB01934.1 putative polyprenyl diphosphate synthase [Streptomyces sp. SN-593]
MMDFGPFNVSMLDPDLLASLTRGMAAVNLELRLAAESAYPPVTEVSRYLIDAGGKRFRPALTLLTAHYGDASAPGVAATATACELTHLATLHHDDVMDESSLRRGVPSTNARFGNLVAVLSGDYLFSKASQIMAGQGPEAVMIQASTFERLVTGQIRESTGPAPGEDPLEHYLSVVSHKTASLIATSARFGALMAGAPAGVVERVTEFGEYVGTAFQLADDILDIAGDSRVSGKRPGTDLREGVATLPTLYVRAAPAPGDKRLIELLDSDLTDDTLHTEALGLLRRHPALAQAQQECTAYAERARDLLKPLPPGPVTDALDTLCDLAVHRVS